MKRGKRIFIGICCVALLLVSWLIVAKTKSASQKQADLLDKALAMMNNGIYVGAVPLLEEAAEYKTDNTLVVEEYLKEAYLELIETRGYRKKYRTLLDMQMKREDADPDVFAQAALHYIEAAQISNALEILRKGIEKTSSQMLIELYEENRYVYETNRATYSHASEIFESKAQVNKEGLWGLASAEGNLLIPCQYEAISTYSNDRAIVKKDEEIYAVNIDNNRIALLETAATEFGNLADNRIALLLEEGWIRATGEFEIGTAVFEEIGMYCGGYAAAKVNGKWGVVDLSLNWLVPAEFDGIVQDELGRCWGQGAVFVRQSEAVFMLVNGQQVGQPYDDARPFSQEGYAAVKNNGKWGFVDIEGNLLIEYCFDDALSFGQHLAAVRLDEFWGYISRYGELVIEPIFEEAKSFSGGSAPVLTARGWQFITLLEYRKGAGL